MASKNQPLYKYGTPGRKRTFRTAKALMDACIKYFEWVKENPWREDADFHYQGNVVPNQKNLVRAMTITGLCLHIGITTKCWRQWRTKDNPEGDKSAEDWKAVVEWAEAVIWEQKFTAAAAGLLRENIISRELGLQERTALFGVNANFDAGKLSDDDATAAYLEAMKGVGTSD